MDEEVRLEEFPIVKEMIISNPSLAYLSGLNDFAEIVTLTIITSDDQVYGFAMSPEQVRKCFNLPPL